MKKVFLRGYLKKNLGDDLFFKTICERYKNNFYTVSNYGNFKLKNLHVKKLNYFYKIINFLNFKIFSKNNVLERKLENCCDLTVVIGGSLFVENPNINIEKSVHLNSFCNSDHNNYMIGINFGPYMTDKYLHAVKRILLKHNDVCFRDKASYNLFSDCENVRVAPDILFSLNKIQDYEINNKNVVISVIDCSYKNRPNNLKKRANDYDNAICDIINKFNDLGYKCILMSFCKFEGDEAACKRIKKLCIKKYSIKCETYFYTGNLTEALKVLASSAVIVGSRFHANVIGMVFNKGVIPISYNCKTINMLKDIGFNGLTIDIDDITSFNVESITNNILEYRVNIETIKQNSIKHFEKLDEILVLNEGE